MQVCQLTWEDVHADDWYPPLPLASQAAACPGNSNTGDLISLDCRRNESDVSDLHEKLSEDDARVEEAEPEAAKFRSTGLSYPERRDGEHDTDGDACKECLVTSNGKSPKWNWDNTPFTPRPAKWVFHSVASCCKRMPQVDTMAAKRICGFRPYFSSSGAESHAAKMSQAGPIDAQADRYRAGTR